MPDETPTERIHAHITGHYAATPDRLLYLAQLGSWMSTSGLRPPPGTRVSDWLKDLLGPEFVIIVDPANPVRRAIVPAERMEWGLASFRPRAASGLSAHAALRCLPKTVLLAFVKHLEPDERIFIDTHPPHRFQVNAQSPGPGWLEVPSELRVDGVSSLENTDALSLEHAEALLHSVRQWCESNGRHLDDFTFQRTSSNQSAPERVLRQSTSAPGSALQRLIAAQPPGARPEILIPMDIAELLLRHK